MLPQHMLENIGFSGHITTKVKIAIEGWHKNGFLSYDESSVVETRRWSAPGLNGSQSRVSCLGSSELCSGPANCVQFNYLNECYCAQRQAEPGARRNVLTVFVTGRGHHSPGWSPPPRSIMTNAHRQLSVSIVVSVLENINVRARN